MPDKQNSPITLCKLERLSLISASGPDATAFLQSQLTNDIHALPQHQACLAGYCTPKGRMLASMLAWKTDAETIFLEVPTELREPLQKRLQMYVMRSKLKLTSETHSVLGINGKLTNELSEWFPTLPAEPFELVESEAGNLIRLTDANTLPRYQWIVLNSQIEQIWPTVTTKLTIVPENVWARSEIHAGIPTITAATQEKFVPQMINYELIGGVNFKKGCYPGQEIVARTHYLGKQKRRMVLARIDNKNVQNGMEVFSNDEPNQPCGMVVNAAPNEENGSDCLIEIKLNYLNDVVKLSSGEVCHWLPMPYSLPIEE